MKVERRRSVGHPGDALAPGEVEVTLRRVPFSAELVHYIRKCARGLEQPDGGRLGCHVIVARTSDPFRPGNLYEARIEVVSPAGPLRVIHTNADEYLAVRGAFETLITLVGGLSAAEEPTAA